MTMPELPVTTVTLSLTDHIATRVAVGLARVLARRKPKQIKAVLARLRSGSRQATAAEALRARDTVLTASPRCSGPQACLPRSIASALLCRIRGAWPVWCVGVLIAPPFTAHAWIEAEGQLIGEMLDGDCYRRMIALGPTT